MKDIIWTIGFYYIGVGLIAGILIGRATQKYRSEVEDNLGEEVNNDYVKILMVVTVFTWPKKLIWLIKYVVVNLLERIEVE